MTFYPIKRKWRNKPPSTARLKPRARDALRFLCIFNEAAPRDLVHDIIPTLGSSYTSGPEILAHGESGICATDASIDNDRLTFAYTPDYNLSGGHDVTFMVRANTGTISDNTGYTIISQGNANPWWLGFWGESGNDAITYWDSNLSGLNDRANNITANEWNTSTLILRTSINDVHTRNLVHSTGVLSTATDTNTTNITPGSSTDDVYFASYSGGGEPLNANAVDFIAIWAKELPTALIEEIEADPWNFFFEPDTIYFPLGAAAATTPVFYPIKRKWARKPRTGEAKLRSEITKGLRFFSLCDQSPHDIAGLDEASVDSDYTTVGVNIPNDGSGLVPDFSGNSAISYTAGRNDLYNTDFSIFSRLYCKSFSDFRTILCESDGTNWEYSFSIRKTGASLAEETLSFYTQAQTWSHMGPNKAIAANTWYVVSIVGDDAADDAHFRIYNCETRSLVESEDDHSTKRFDIAQNTDGLRVGGANAAGTSEPFDGYIDFVAVWDWMIPNAWKEKIEQDPWNFFFEPEIIYFPLGVAAATAAAFYPIRKRKYKNTARTFFDGSSELISISDIASARYEYDTAWTHIQFFKVVTEAGDERTFFNKWGGGGADSQINVRADSAGRIEFGWDGTLRWWDPGSPADISAQIGKWSVLVIRNDTTNYHMAVYDLATLSEVISLSTSAPTANADTLTADIQLGLRGTSNDEFDGCFSHTAYFSEFLSLSEVFAFCRDPEKIAQGRAEFYIKLDTPGPFEQDCSGNGNHATASTSPAPGIGEFPAALLKPEIIYFPLGAAAAGDAEVTLSGLEVDAEIGTLTATGEAILALSGLESSTELGTLTATGGALSALTGLESSTEIGTLTSIGSASISLTGLESTSELGALTSTGGASTSLTGLESSTEQGTLGIITNASISLTGLEASTEIGTLSVNVEGGVSVTLTGLEASTEIGTLTTIGSAALSLAGLEATTEQGTLTSTGGASVSLTGLEAATEQGTLTIEIEGGVSITLTGLEASIEQGALTVTGDSAVTLSGLEVTAEQGTLTVSLGVGGHVIGTITIQPAVDATISLQPSVKGDITIN